MMIQGSKVQKAVHACMIRLLNLGPAKHEKVAIYVVNQRISNVYRIAGAALQQSNSQASVDRADRNAPSAMFFRERQSKSILLIDRRPLLREFASVGSEQVS